MLVRERTEAIPLDTVVVRQKMSFRPNCIFRAGAAPVN